MRKPAGRRAFLGPVVAALFIEQHAPFADRTNWLDEAWCEGGAVLDEDKRVLVWFGGEDILYKVRLRRAHLDLMARPWPGWEIRWAFGDIVDLGEYVGIPREKLLVDSKHTEYEYGFRFLTDHPEGNDILLTVRESGRETVGRVCGDEESLQVGSSQLPLLLNLARRPSLDWSGEMPVGGLHFDVDSRVLTGSRSRSSISRIE